MKTCSRNLVSTCWLMAAVAGIIMGCGCMHGAGGLAMTGERTAFIHAGMTQRTEVVETLGVPAYDFPELRAMAYPWEMESPAIYYTDPFGRSNLVYQKQARWLFCLSLDERGYVTRHGRILQPKLESDRETVLRWLAEQPR